MTDERAFLDTVSGTYTRGATQDAIIRQLIVRTFAPFIDTQTRALQLGFAEGVDTGLLAPLVGSVDVVEGSSEFIEAARQSGLANLTVHDALFEQFAVPEGAAPYDAIFAVYVLEHVDDPDVVLSNMRRCLAPGGRLFVVVPNARALSRQLARHMGLLDDLTTLTEHDHAHGHRRVYDRVTLNRDIAASGFRSVTEGGILLKLLADFQLDQCYAQGILGEAQVEGLYRMGLEYPDFCGSLFSVCEAVS